MHKRRGFLIIKMLVDIIPVITLIEDKAMRRFDGLCKSVLRYIFFASFFALLLAASGCVPNEDNAAQSEIPPPPTASLPVVEETPARKQAARTPPGNRMPKNPPGARRQRSLLPRPRFFPPTWMNQSRWETSSFRTRPL